MCETPAHRPQIDWMAGAFRPVFLIIGVTFLPGVVRTVVGSVRVFNRPDNSILCTIGEIGYTDYPTLETDSRSTSIRFRR